MNNSAYLLLIVAIGFSVVGQILLKRGMSRRPAFRIGDLASLIRDFSVVSGFASYGISTLLYFKVLANLDLSLAYPTVSLGYVIVVILSKRFFEERISPARWAAVVIICTGVALVGLGRG